jgi:hypothetical protein
MNNDNQIKDNSIIYKKALLGGLQDLSNRYFFGMFQAESEEVEYSLRDNLLKVIELLEEETNIGAKK